MKDSEQKRRFKSRRTFYVLGAIALLPIIFGCQKALSAKNHPSSPVPPAPGPAIEPSPVEVPFTTPVKTYKTKFSTFFLSPDGQCVAGQTDSWQNGNKEQAFLSKLDGTIVKSLPIDGYTLVPYGTTSPWSQDSKKLLTLSPNTNVLHGNLLVYPLINNKIGKSIYLHAPGSILDGAIPSFSPNGHFVAAGVNISPELSAINSLVTWKIDQSPVFGPRIFTFRLNVGNIAWIDNRHIWVFTRGKDLSKGDQSNDSTDDYHTEIYLLDCVTGHSRSVKEVTTRDILNIFPYTDEEGHLIAVTSQNREEDLEVFDPKTEKCVYRQPLGPPYPHGLLIPGAVNLWQVIGNAQHVYLYCVRNSYVDIRPYNQNSGTLGKTYHLNITWFPSIDNSGQVWCIKNGAGKKNGVLLNFGKLE